MSLSCRLTRDLSLPTYTSNIVNVGIQQSGIDEEIPENISEEEMNRLLLFVSEDDRQDIQDAYEKVVKALITMEKC